MPLSEKEKKLCQFLRTEKLKEIKKRFWAEEKKINWMPNKTEYERLQLDIKNRRQYLEDALKAYVSALIETIQKVGKNVDDAGVNELVEMLKLVVDSILKGFSGKYKKNPFSPFSDESFVDNN